MRQYGTEGKNRHGNFENLFGELHNGIFKKFADCGEVSVERRGHRNKRETDGENFQRRNTAHIADPFASDKVSKNTHCRRNQNTAQQRIHGALPDDLPFALFAEGDIIGNEPHRCKTHTTRSESDSHCIDGGNQLKQSDAVSADFICKVNAENHGNGFHDKICHRQKHGVLH